MALKDFVVQGHVYQGGSKITSGLVRVRNTSIPDVVVAVKIGQTNDGTPNLGFYDAWWVSGGASSAPDVAELGDVFEVSVYPLSAVSDPDLPLELLTEPVSTSEPPLIPAQSLPALTQTNVGTGLLVYDIYANANSLPHPVVIIPEELGNAI